MKCKLRNVARDVSDKLGKTEMIWKERGLRKGGACHCTVV